MFIQELIDKQINQTVWGVCTTEGGCYQVFPSKRKAQNFLNRIAANPSFFEYWANSATGSVMMSYATGRYTISS